MVASERDTKTLRVVVADGDVAACQDLVQRLGSLSNVQVVASETTAGNAIVAAYRTKPDAVLLDLTPPDRPAAETVRHLIAACPGVSVVMLVDRDEDARLTPALDAGARESVLKSAPAERIGAVLARLGPNRTMAADQ